MSQNQVSHAKRIGNGKFPPIIAPSVAKGAKSKCFCDTCLIVMSVSPDVKFGRASLCDLCEGKLHRLSYAIRAGKVLVTDTDAANSLTLYNKP